MCGYLCRCAAIVAVVVVGLRSPNSITKLDVANHGLRAIGNLALDNYANQTQLGEHGAAAGALARLICLQMSLCSLIVGDNDDLLNLFIFGAMLYSLMLLL